MISRKLKDILTFNGLSLLIGIVGGLASILTVFVTDWDYQIGMKWFVFTLFICISLLFISAKLVFDLNVELSKTSNKSAIISYLADHQMFLIEPNNNLGHQALISLYYNVDNFEVDFAIGYVKNIQDDFIQVQILNFNTAFVEKHGKLFEKVMNNNTDALTNLIVKSYITHQINS